MNILLINHYAGSPKYGMEYRAYYLAREWVRLGHSVQVMASAESHCRAKKPELMGLDRLNEIIDGIHYTWLATPVYYGNGVGRAINMAVFVGRLYREGKQIAKLFKPDVVIASSTYPMDIWPARRIARMVGAKLVFEVHDLWPLSPMELAGMSKWHPFIVIVQIAEDFAYRHSDIIVSMLPKAREYMESRGMAPAKLHVIQNGIDNAEWQGDIPDLHDMTKKTLSTFKAQGLSILGYAGTHGLANSLDTLIDAAKLMKDEEVVFVLVGGGPEKIALQQRVQADKLHNVCFIDPIKKEQIPSLLEWFDVAYIGLQRQHLFRFGIAPNKLMDYMMAGRPVLMAIDAGNDLVTEACCGLSVTPEDPQAVAQGIRSLLKLSEDERKAMGQRGKDYVMQHHDYHVLAKRFLDVFNYK